MKVTLSGRPGSIEKRGDVVVTTMTDIAQPQNIPRIIPRPPDTPTLYTVYIWTKQWEKIEESMADPTDIMLLDGVCAFDPETNSMAIFAANVYSELLNAKAKEATAAAKPVKQPKPPKEAKPAADKAAKAKAPAPVQTQVQGKDVKKSRYDDVQSEPVAAAVPLNPNLPPDVARKLNELNASAALFRQKVNNLLAKPAGQQFGLEMTQKLLKNVEDEITALKQKHNV